MLYFSPRLITLLHKHYIDFHQTQKLFPFKIKALDFNALFYSLIYKYGTFPFFLLCPQKTTM